MASSPVTAPPSDSDSPPAPPTSNAPPPDDSSSSSPPPPSDDSTSPPPPSSDDSSSSPLPQSPPSQSPPPKQSSPSPPPQSSNNPSPPPPNESDESPPPDSSSPPPPSPPPPSSGNKSPPAPSSGGSSSSPPPPPPPPPPTMTPPSVPSKSHTPPAPKALSPSSHKHSPSHSKGDSAAPTNHQSDVNVPLVAGVTAGVGVFIVLMILVFVCRANKKKKRPHDAMRYYGDPSNGGSRMPKGGDYYNSGPNWHGVPPSMDHIVKVPPPPGTMASPGGGWNPPPLPATTMSSSDMSSSYSGPHGPPLPPPSPNIALGFNKSTFTYDELAAATSGFSQANLLGQGGFGYVHKGVLPNGKEIAVKQLKAGSGQGEREFQAEVEIISRVHHRHLVSLVGYCIAGEQRMLVYEFVPNKTLEFHLHGKDRPVMDFPTRLKIALGSAKGLAYLHEDCHPRIIHRDIKAANILLDYKFEAMVADFGLAKLSSDNYTHVSTRVMGTFGYLAPEYASSGKLTEKSDVFSFGIMLLELITGRRPVDNNTYMEDSLVDWARPLLTQSLNDGNFDDLADPRLEGNYNPNEMARLVACAAASVRHSARRRPKMSQIVRALEGDSSLEDLNEGIKPGHSTVFGSSESSEYDGSSYHSEMRKFQKVALASQEFSSGEQGASREMNSTAFQRHGL